MSSSGKCIVCNKKCALFNFPKKSPKYCKKCSQEGMIDVFNKRCEHPNCDKLASFNFKGEKKRIFCGKHKLKNMIKIHKKVCNFEDCLVGPSYNFPDEKKPIRCTEHKLEGMIDFLHRKYKCCFKDCKITAHFNFKGEKKGLYCNEHKSKGMINVVSKRCAFENCELRPLFNYEEEKTALYCSNHRLKGMIDLRHARCEHKDCYLAAYFNYKDQKKGRFCSHHKFKYMIDVLHDVCLVDGCNIAGRFNFKGQKKGLYCASHRKENMIDVKRKMCEVCNLTTAWIEKKYCRGCFVFLNPDHSSNKNFLYKQKEIIKELEEEFKIDQTDRRIQGGCSKRRPDVVIDRFSHVVIVEIDEDQHKYYNKECEQQRINDLYQDFGYRPIVMIRFNPDSYSIFNDWTQRILGMFDKQKRKRKVEYELRINKLKEVLNKHVFNVPKEHFTKEYLYYDIIQKVELIFVDENDEVVYFD